MHDPRICTCLNLRAAARRLTRRYEDALAPSGILIAQFSILNYVAAVPGIGVAALAGMLDMDISTVTRNLRPLLASRLLAMRTAVSDARRREVRLTPKGRRDLDKALGLWDTVNTQVTSELGARRSKEFLATLSSLG